jgi:hypothetical protein
MSDWASFQFAAEAAHAASAIWPIDVSWRLKRWFSSWALGGIAGVKYV